MHFQYVYGIDIGTSAVKIYTQKTDAILREKNMIAIRGDDTVFAVGDDAYEMYEKTPQNIRIITPMSKGRINDMLMMEAVLHTLLSRTGSSMGYRPFLYFSVPIDMTEIERRAYSTIAHRGALRHCRVYLVEKPIADAIALGVPIHHTKGALIVNIGAESTEVTILSEGHVMISRLISIGGDQFDDAIIAHVRKKNNFLISRKSARMLKRSLTDMSRDLNQRMRIMGVDTVTGLPRDGEISSYTVTLAVKEEVIKIAEELRRILERTPPQVRATIANDGIYMTGGSTLIPGLENFFANHLDYRVRISKYHDLSTIYGLKTIINHPEMQHWAVSPGRSKNSGNNYV